MLGARHDPVAPHVRHTGLSDPFAILRLDPKPEVFRVRNANSQIGAIAGTRGGRRLRSVQRRRWFDWSRWTTRTTRTAGTDGPSGPTRAGRSSRTSRRAGSPRTVGSQRPEVRCNGSGQLQRRRDNGAARGRGQRHQQAPGDVMLCRLGHLDGVARRRRNSVNGRSLLRPRVLRWRMGRGDESGTGRLGGCVRRHLLTSVTPFGQSFFAKVMHRPLAARGFDLSPPAITFIFLASPVAMLTHTSAEQGDGGIHRVGGV